MSVGVDLWKAMTHEPGTGVSLVGVDGRIYYVNPTAVEMIGKHLEVDPVGRMMWEFFPDELVRERLAIWERVHRESRCYLLRHISNGKEFQSTFWPAAEERILIVMRPGATEEISDDIGVVETAFVALGPLDCLTRRELEVLAMVGHGLTTAEIAKALHRAPKTIENHRASIVRKLRARNVADLVRIVCGAGLRIEDAQLKRISI